MTWRVWTWLVALCAGRLLAADLPARTPAEAAAAAAQAQPGDVIILADGTWSNADLALRGRGTADRPITLRAATPGRVVLTGASRVRLGGSWLVVEGLRFQGPATGRLTPLEFRYDSQTLADHCRVTQCAIVDYSPPDATTDTKWVSLYGQANRLDHCYLAGKTNAGTTVVVWVGDQPNEHRIDHNHFGPRPVLGQNGGETIRVGTSDVSLRDSATVVEANLFTACNGEAEIISSKSCGNVYRRNTFRACDGTLTLRHGNRCLVDGNFFLGANAKRSGGVRIIGEDHRVQNNYFADLTGTGARAAIAVMQGIVNSPPAGYYQVQRATVAFNTIVNCRQAFEIGTPGSQTTLPPVDCRFAHNLVVGSQAPLVKIIRPAERSTWSGNLLFGAEVGLTDPGLRLVDPRLEQAADGLWRPAADSPARGAAATGYDEVTADLDGQPRVAPRDAGCDQRSDAPVVSRPLTAADTGPDWLTER